MVLQLARRNRIGPYVEVIMSGLFCTVSVTIAFGTHSNTDMHVRAPIDSRSP